MIILKFLFLKIAIFSLFLDLRGSEKCCFVFTLFFAGILYFDLIANQKSIAINRVGQYFRRILEKRLGSPKLINETLVKIHNKEINVPDFIFWERFLAKNQKKGKPGMTLLFISNFLLIIGLALTSYFFELKNLINNIEIVFLMILLGTFIVIDVMLNLYNAGFILKEK